MKRIVFVGLVVTLILGVWGIAYGKSTYMTTFNSTYSNSSLKGTMSCTVCHISGGFDTNSYGTAYMDSGHSFSAIESADSDGDTYTNIAEINAGTYPGDVTSKPTADITKPTVSAFSVPSTSSSLTVTVTTFTATDTVGVTGYMITESSTAPVSGDSGWSTSAPSSFAASSAGAKTLYAWAKDAAGNVSTGMSDSVTITLASNDSTPPTVTFSMPSTATSLTVSITLSATDTGGTVAGYLVKETSSEPAVNDSGWVSAAPTSYTFNSAGSKPLYAWAKDNSNNISAVKNAAVTITISGGDSTAPTVTFSMPSTATSLTVSISLSATDDAGTVTGYLVKTTGTDPEADDSKWVSTALTSYTFSFSGSQALYAWAKDDSGNVSDAASAIVNITVQASDDAIAPKIKAFSVPASSNSLTIQVKTFIATDNEGVTGYLINESSAAPSPDDAGWSSTKPTSYIFESDGVKTLFAWAKDAAGNVSTSKSANVKVDATPPTVTAFSLPETSKTTKLTVTFTATDTIGVKGYMITTSSTAPTAKTGGWKSKAPSTFTVKKQGENLLYAWAKDAVGNVSESLSATVTVDTKKPTAPSGLMATVTSGSVSLSWTASNDDGGVTEYLIFRDKVQVGTSTALNYDDTGLSPSKKYKYTVKSVDALENISAPSRTLPVTTSAASGVSAHKYSGISGTIPVPAGQQSFIYDQVSQPVISTDPEAAMPIGGDFALNGIVIGTAGFSAPVDMYVVLYNADLDLHHIYVLNQEGEYESLNVPESVEACDPDSFITLISEYGLGPWKADATGPVNGSVSEKTDLSQLAQGAYRIGLFVTTKDNMKSFYLWTTTFTVR